MDPDDSRAEYRVRLHRVLGHIDQHLDQPLDLPRLAAVAHFSPFHFHRLFSAFMGETLGDYLRRRRVEVAAQRLLTMRRLSVLQAALDVGFGSGEAFTRAFKARFGSAPSAWRRLPHRPRTELRNPGQMDRKNDQDGSAIGGQHDLSFSTEPEPHPMQVQLIDRKPTRVAYLRHTGPYGASVGRFYGTDVAPWLQRHGWMGRERFGISQDDPSVTEPAQCRYDACVTLPADFQPPRGMLTTTLQGGRYAVLAFEGTTDAIAAAWQHLCRNWLPEHSLQPGNGPGFEHYPPGSRYDPDTGVFDCGICIPVVPL
jgi:AraC family transcriptional regulator